MIRKIEKSEKEWAIRNFRKQFDHQWNTTSFEEIDRMCKELEEEIDNGTATVEVWSIEELLNMNKRT